MTLSEYFLPCHIEIVELITSYAIKMNNLKHYVKMFIHNDHLKKGKK